MFSFPAFDADAGAMDFHVPHVWSFSGQNALAALAEGSADEKQLVNSEHLKFITSFRKTADNSPSGSLRSTWISPTLDGNTPAVQEALLLLGGVPRLDAIDSSGATVRLTDWEFDDGSINKQTVNACKMQFFGIKRGSMNLNLEYNGLGTIRLQAHQVCFEV